jgi:carbamoyltransferase
MVDVTVVLGYSGLDGSAELLTERPDLSGPERRIFQGMDAAAALLVDGRLVAAVQEERFTGIKFDHRYPVGAMRWCLADAGLSERDVDIVAHGFAYAPYEKMFHTEPARRRYRTVLSPTRQNELLREHFPELGRRLQVRQVRHHHAHAHSAIAAANFDDCLVVVMDGMGETDAISVFRSHDGALQPLATQDVRSSLGIFYSLITLHLGYQPNSDEYHVMALAAYGDESRFRSVVEDAIHLTPGGRVRVPMLDSPPDDPYREQYRAGREWLAERTFPGLHVGESHTSMHADLAAAAQSRLEQAIIHVVSFWINETGIRRVALAGGVALNSVANGRLLREGVDELFVQPAAGDEGTAIGAAVAASTGTLTDYPPLPLLGPVIDDVQPDRGRQWRRATGDGAIELAADLLARGAVVGWANGRLEFGPRALGNRSILADPRRPDMRDRVNGMVKFRESYRPLAPAVLADYATDWFDVPAGANLRHMSVVVNVKRDHRPLIPAVVHVDGSARVQVVYPDEHPVFWRLLEQFRKMTGCPVLLNTSLNVKGQPMAMTAADALKTFDASSLDVLFVNDRFLARGQYAAVPEAVQQ